MRKALVNYWVDLATAIAFVVCAVTGIVFLFPGTVHSAVGVTPTILLIPATWWHSVHDWSGIAMVAGTALHLALHARWIATMTRRTFGSPTNAEAAGAGRPSRTAQPSRVAGAAPQPAAGAADVAVAPPATAIAAGTPADRIALEADGVAASLQRLEAFRAERGREREQRTSRRRFLVGAAALGGAALLAAVGLVGRDAASGASTRPRDDGSTGSGQGQSGTGASGAGASEGSGAGGDGNGSGSGSSGSGAQNGSSGGSSSTRVVVSQSACVACGRCLQACPRGVFDWSSSGRAEAINADACTRCGRCLQVCPAGAISVSA